MTKLILSDLRFACRLWLAAWLAVGIYPVFAQQKGDFTTEYLTPVRIVLTDGEVEHAGHLLQPSTGQPSLVSPHATYFAPRGSVLLDFGKEIQGGIQIVSAMWERQTPARFRLVLGESVSEALSNAYADSTTATNEHAVRDLEIRVPCLGTVEYGNSGFRFARLEYIDEPTIIPRRETPDSTAIQRGDTTEVMTIPIVAVRAISKKRDLQYLGSFQSDDERLNRIWQTGAYTVHLCMQDYLWDGIKRDRLVWIGDMQPEVMTASAVFGDQEVVHKSLDLVRDETPADGWMNGIPSYSLMWMLIHHHLYKWYGDDAYLRQQQDYLAKLTRHVISNIEDNRAAFRGGWCFIDWPTNDQKAAVNAGLQGLAVLALEAGADMAGWLGDKSLEEECLKRVERLRTFIPDSIETSQAAALLSLAKIIKADDASAIILRNGAEKFTSFMGYYFLEALAHSGHYEEAMQLISDYWGGMLDLGATTFWEDFNYSDGKKGARIDEVVPEGKFDIHADGGAWCYIGLRHSLCHGWASGPTAWLSRHVLGIEPADVGFKKVRITPHLGHLNWVEGSVPTPYGIIKVSHRKKEDGTVVSTIKLPKGIKRVK